MSEALPEAGPELALVEAARIHQPGAMERLLARFGGRVYACALRMTADAELAEEITHDVFLSLLCNVEFAARVGRHVALPCDPESVSRPPAPAASGTYRAAGATT